MLRGIAAAFLAGATMLASEAPAHSQVMELEACRAGWFGILEKGNVAYWNAPDSEKHRVHEVTILANDVLDGLNHFPDRYSNDFCGARFATYMQILQEWRQRGWLPTSEEKAAAAEVELRKRADALAERR